MPPPLVYNTYDTNDDPTVDAHVRALLSATAPLSYDNSTGVLSLTTPLDVSHGGTGFSSFANGELVYGNGTNVMSKLSYAGGTFGTVLVGQGPFFPPAWGKVQLDNTLGQMHVIGILGCVNGGTGLNATSAGELIYGSGVNTFNRLAPHPAGEVLHSNGAAPPFWDKVSMTADVSGVLPVANGGTGLSTMTAANRILYSTAAGTLTTLAGPGPSAALITNGSGVPTWATAGTPDRHLVLRSGGVSWGRIVMGTDFTGITLGDIPWGNGTGLGFNLLSYSGGTPGNALIGRGPALGPAWGKIELSGSSQHVNGVLGVANGGTGTGTTFTTGSVVFAGSSGIYSEDNSQLYWDFVNNRLGIGTNTPSFQLQVLGANGSTFSRIGSSNAYWEFTTVALGGEHYPVLNPKGNAGATDTIGVIDGGLFLREAPTGTFPQIFLINEDATQQATIALESGSNVRYTATTHIFQGTVQLLTPLAAIYGGTGLSSYAQGDILYASAANTLAALAKNTTATRYLSNTGTNNNPAWAQINLANGVTGTLPVGNGGTGLSTFTAANRLVYSTGATTLTTLASTASRVLVTDGSGVPNWNNQLPDKLGIGTAADSIGSLKTLNAMWIGGGDGSFIGSASAFGFSVYTGIVLGQGNGGALFACGRLNSLSLNPFTGFTGYDWGSLVAGVGRTLYFGGGAWDAPDANFHEFYTAPTYTETKDTGVMRMKIWNDGKIGIGPGNTPTALLDIESDVVRLRTAKTPASAAAAGNQGDICWDSGFIYVCTATNTWKRAAIATW